MDADFDEMKEEDGEEHWYPLIKDKFFRYVASVAPEIVGAVTSPFLGRRWRKAKPYSQADLVGKYKRAVPDGALLLGHDVAMTELDRRLTRKTIIKAYHKKLCVARASALVEFHKIKNMDCIVFSDKRNIAGGNSKWTFQSEGLGDERWPRFRLSLIDISKPQATKEQDDVCHDLLAKDLHEMRSEDIINAVRKALPKERNPMKKLYKDYEKIVRKKGREEGELNMAAKIVEANAMTLSQAAAFSGHSEEELRQFMASRKLKPA